MESSILFLNDGSLINPIIKSQGLPLLKELADTGFACTFCSFEPLKMSEQHNEKLKSIRKEFNTFINFKEVITGKYCFLPNSIMYFYKGFRIVTKLVKTYNIRIIHARSLYPVIIGIIVKLFYPRLRVIYDNRGVFIEEEIFKSHWRRGGIKERIFKLIENKVLKKADHIVVVSKAFKKYLLEKYSSNKANLNNKISVISNKTLLNHNLDSQKLNLRMHNEKVTCIYAGSGVLWQNIPEIISFAEKCNLLVEDFNLKIVTYHPPTFKIEINKSKDLKEITKIIEVDSDNVLEHLLTANFGLLLRENNLINKVSSPLKFAEYLAAGLPVMVSEGVGDTEQIIQQYKVGVIIRDKNYKKAINNMMELLKDPEIHDRCRNTAKKEFNIRDAIDTFRSVYFKLLYE